jgi:hypothetical protein
MKGFIAICEVLMAVPKKIVLLEYDAVQVRV